MTKSFFLKLVSLIFFGTVLVPVFAVAQTDVDVQAAATVRAAGLRANASTTISVQAMTMAKTRADQEIGRRITALNNLNTRVQEMQKVTPDFKTALSTNIQAQITALTALKTKIDADTDGATLKADVQSIAQSYRIFVLVLPLAHIAAAADRAVTISSMMSTLGTKLQARIQAAASAGVDVTAINTILGDLSAKIIEANTQAQAAVSTSAALTPDGGDKTKMASNQAALKQARTSIQAAQKALQAARKDIELIQKSLRALRATTTSSSSVETR